MKMPLTANPMFRMVCFNSIGDGEDSTGRKDGYAGYLISRTRKKQLKTNRWLPFGRRVA